MPGKIRDKTVTESRGEIVFRQNEFVGMNIDLPASELGGEGHTGKYLSYIENVISKGGYAEGRDGSERFSYAKMPGSGIVYHSPTQHTVNHKYLFHRGTQLWISDDKAYFWVEVTKSGDTTRIPGAYS